VRGGGDPRGPAAWTVAVLAAWAVVWGASWILPWQLEATGDGFTRGMNRVAAFFGLQLAALLPALIALSLRGRLAPGTWPRRLSLVPLAAFALLVLAVLGVILWSRLARP